MKLDSPEDEGGKLYSCCKTCLQDKARREDLASQAVPLAELSSSSRSPFLLLAGSDKINDFENLKYAVR